MSMRKARVLTHPTKERVTLLIIALAGLLDSAVVVLSLTYLTSDYRSDLLFNDSFMDWSEQEHNEVTR